MKKFSRDAGRHRVLLYNPRAEFFTMPLGLLAVGSHLDPQRYEVIIVDGRLEADPVKEIITHLDGALCLGISVLTGPPIRDALRISRAAKDYRPDLPVVWGGWHPSLFGLECLSEESLDLTVQGQGEETLAEVLDGLAQGHWPVKVKGCACRTPDGSPHLNQPRPQKDLNHFRPHDYSLIPVGRYFELKGKRQLDYISSQGCPFRCAFCAEPLVSQRRWSGLEPERVGEEVEALWQTYRFTDLSFQDETFFTRPERVVGIAEEFLRRRLPITWATTLRADQGEGLPDDVWAQCAQSGLRRVIIGVESGSQEIMNRILKDINLRQVFNCAKKCQRHGIAAIFNFIVGFPWETESDFRATLEVARRLRRLSPQFQTPFFYYLPYPGSRLFAEVEGMGFRPPRSLEEWADFETTNSTGPWVTPAKFKLVERLNFYRQMAVNPSHIWPQPLPLLARWRCRHDFYALPLEKVLGQRWLPPRQSE